MAAERKGTTDEQTRQLLDIYEQLDERDRHRLILAAQSLLSVAEDNRRRGF